MTLTEVLVVIAVLAVLVVMLIPATDGRMPKAYQINCVNSLKQIGLAYKIWAGDHNDKFPMQVSITDTNGSGTMELATGANAWINFAVMSNELSTPKILWCPADTEHSAATNFATDFNNSKISYFVGLDADPSKPQMLLSGDDNFAVGGVPVKSGLAQIPTNSNVAWTSGRHVSYSSHFWTPERNKFVGNIGLADGSSQTVNYSGLTNLLQQTGLATNRLAIP